MDKRILLKLICYSMEDNKEDLPTPSNQTTVMEK